MIPTPAIIAAVLNIAAGLLLAPDLLWPYRGMTHRVIDITCDGSGKTEQTPEYEKYQKHQRVRLLIGILALAASTYVTIYNS